MSKHTSGPWHSARVSEKTWHVGVYDAAGVHIALLRIQSALHGSRRNADARLISAAPMLLEALEALVLQRIGDDNAAMREARAAIKAVKGKA